VRYAHQVHFVCRFSYYILKWPESTRTAQRAKRLFFTVLVINIEMARKYTYPARAKRLFFTVLVIGQLEFANSNCSIFNVLKFNNETMAV